MHADYIAYAWAGLRRRFPFPTHANITDHERSGCLLLLCCKSQPARRQQQAKTGSRRGIEGGTDGLPVTARTVEAWSSLTGLPWGRASMHRHDAAQAGWAGAPWLAGSGAHRGWPPRCRAGEQGRLAGRGRDRAARRSKCTSRRRACGRHGKKKQRTMTGNETLTGNMSGEPDKTP